MAQPLLPDRRKDEDSVPPCPPKDEPPQEMADLKVFWGPEICRLEYLVHLLETGRVKDDDWPRSA